jgi:hypothetical protein
MAPKAEPVPLDLLDALNVDCASARPPAGVA